LWLLTALGGSTLNALAVVIVVASFDTLYLKSKGIIIITVFV